MGAELLVALVAAFAAGTVSGLTGFGLALISVPLLLFVHEPRTVVLLTAVFSLFINSAVVRDSWRDVDRRMVLTLTLPSFVGTAMGVELLRVVDPVYIRFVAGLVVVFSALLLLRDVRLPGAQTRWRPVVAGWTSGALSTSTGLAAPPIVLLLASRKFAKHAFRGSSALYFLLMSVFGLVLLSLRGLVRAATSRSPSSSSPPPSRERRWAPGFCAGSRKPLSGTSPSYRRDRCSGGGHSRPGSATLATRVLCSTIRNGRRFVVERRASTVRLAEKDR